MTIREYNAYGKEDNLKNRDLHCIGLKRNLTVFAKRAVYIFLIVAVSSFFFWGCSDNGDAKQSSTAKEETIETLVEHKWLLDLMSIRNESIKYEKTINRVQIVDLMWENDPSCTALLGEHINQYKNFMDRAKQIKITPENRIAVEPFAIVFEEYISGLTNLKDGCTAKNSDEKHLFLDEAIEHINKSTRKGEEVTKVLTALKVFEAEEAMNAVVKHKWIFDLMAIHDESSKYDEKIKFQKIVEQIWDGDYSCAPELKKHITKYDAFVKQAKLIKITPENKKVVEPFVQSYNELIDGMTYLYSACGDISDNNKSDVIDKAAERIDSSLQKSENIIKALKDIEEKAKRQKK